jgi:hypothetical protein
VLTGVMTCLHCPTRASTRRRERVIERGSSATRWAKECAQQKQGRSLWEKN